MLPFLLATARMFGVNTPLRFALVPLITPAVAVAVRLTVKSAAPSCTTPEISASQVNVTSLLRAATA